jgi:hypothetical protein
MVTLAAGQPSRRRMKQPPVDEARGPLSLTDGLPVYAGHRPTLWKEKVYAHLALRDGVPVACATTAGAQGCRLVMVVPLTRTRSVEGTARR